ncbi:hypothetical protein QJS10_CPB20g01078 [Acorus calamus]|uniref:DNA polymerase delta subunit 4 n=1 Tax=Acorus calamus TaxID=4465 RepID=A0AAV9CCJ1_ACOCL|nr:hypothetical protein QJS10_CPB20g01078 [Acorus calamus]
MKSFYRQRKKSSSASGAGKAKATSTSKSKSSKPSALGSHGSFNLHGDYGREEEMMRKFDMDMTYGPCLGMTRLQRWERAHNLGLNPPRDIEHLLRGDSGGGNVGLECLWDGCI